MLNEIYFPFADYKPLVDAVLEHIDAGFLRHAHHLMQQNQFKVKVIKTYRKLCINPCNIYPVDKTYTTWYLV